MRPPRSPTIVGSAVETIVWSSAARNMPSISATKTVVSARPWSPSSGISTRRRRRCRRSSPLAVEKLFICGRVSGRRGQRRRALGAEPVEQEAEVAAPEIGRDAARSPRSRGRRSRRRAACPPARSRRGASRAPARARRARRTSGRTRRLPRRAPRRARCPRARSLSAAVLRVQLEHPLDEAGEARPRVLLGERRPRPRPRSSPNDVLDARRRRGRPWSGSGGRACPSRRRRAARSARPTRRLPRRRRRRGPPRESVPDSPARRAGASVPSLALEEGSRSGARAPLTATLPRPAAMPARARSS